MIKLWGDFGNRLSHYSSILYDAVNAAIFFIVAIAGWSLMPMGSVAPEYTFEIGKPWAYEELTADTDFPIYKTDDVLAAEQAEALKDYYPYYNFVSGQTPASIYIMAAQELEQLQNDGFQKIAIIGKKNSAKLIDVSSIQTPKTAFIKTGVEYQPNLVYDSIQSQRVRESILATVSPTQGMVQLGQKIIDHGDIITPETQQMLVSYVKHSAEKRQTGMTIPVKAGRLILSLVIMGILVLYMMVFRRNLWRLKNVLFFCLMMFLFIAGTFITMRYTQNYTYSHAILFIPFVWIPIASRVFFDSRTAYIVHLTTILIVAVAMPSPFIFIVTQLCLGAVAVASLKDMSQRAQLIRTAAYVMLAFLLVSIAGICIQLNGMVEWHWDWMILVYTFMEGILVVFAYGFIFIFEQTFRLVSGITLVELSNVNSNLMHEFAEKAPGTFQHSLQVSNLATEAAKQIDANALLVRAGALYHDIGKMAAPHYYTENQSNDVNPLLAMSNQKAAQVIINHVEEGVRIAEKHHLPPVIVRFISTHHGKSLVKYFYNSEINQNPGTEVDKNLFSYKGPRPQTKEECILMMADAVEARSRSLKEYTEEQINKMVDDMISQQIESEQYSMSPLSFRDVEEIKQVFKKKLITIYHHRIQYPDLIKQS